MINTAKKSFRFKSFKKKKKMKHDWFDGNCFFMKRELRNFGKKMHKFPNDVNIRVSFHRLRKEFQKTLKETKPKFCNAR
jgi:hypothetical protein